MARQGLRSFLFQTFTNLLRLAFWIIPKTYAAQLGHHLCDGPGRRRARAFVLAAIVGTMDEEQRKHVVAVLQHACQSGELIGYDKNALQGFLDELQSEELKTPDLTRQILLALTTRTVVLTTILQATLREDARRGAMGDGVLDTTLQIIRSASRQMLTSEGLKEIAKSVLPESAEPATVEELQAIGKAATETFEAILDSSRNH